MSAVGETQSGHIIQPPNRSGQDARISKHRELLHAVNESAIAVRNGWVVFVAMMAFFFVAVAGVTHKDLLLDSPVPLPIVQVKIELTRFFQFAPVILVLMHFSVLLQYAMMARKTRALNALLEIEEVKTGSGRTHPLRLELSSYFFVQAMAGPTRSLLLGSFLRTMSWLTLGLFPLALLLYFQTTYLPFHDPLVTWAHRGYLVTDFFVLLSVGIFTRFPDRGFWYGLWSNLRYHTLNVILTLGVWLAALFFSFGVATLPDGFLDKTMKQIGKQVWKKAWTSRVPYGMTDKEDDLWKELGQREAFWLTALLFEGRVDDTKGKVTSWFSRNLVVTDQDLVKDKDFPLNGREVSLYLRGRDLRFASFNQSDLHGADLTGADLRNARLSNADLQNAKLKRANLKGAVLKEAQLQEADLRQAEMRGAVLVEARLRGADLRQARLQGADLTRAQLPNADLRKARLQGAVLKEAQLQGADLRAARLREAKLQKAQMQGANLRNANLQMAVLSDAQMQGADFQRASLQGATMTGVELQGANLKSAQMQGAYLRDAQLQGAFLLGAQLQGAVLLQAQLQGAVFFKAQLQGAVLRQAKLQGANLSAAELHGAVLTGAEIWQIQPPTDMALKLADVENISFKPFTSNLEERKKLEAALNKIPFSQRADTARMRLAPLLDYKKSAAWKNSDDHKTWLGLIAAAKFSDNSSFRSDLAENLAELACQDMTENVWLAQSILDRATMRFNGDTALIYDKLNDDNCDSKRKLPKSMLDRLKAKAEKYKKKHPSSAAATKSAN